MIDSKAFELAGKVAVVTGSSSGIGRAIALELAAAGADVLVHARNNRTEVEDATAEIRRHGRASDYVLADFADLSAVDSFAAGAWQWRGRVDMWVNNAGADILTGDAATRSFDEKLQLLLRVDVQAALHLTKVVGFKMKKNGGGSIINMGWDQAESGMAGNSGELFATTKGAVMSLTRSLAKSLAPEVRVNCIAPGWIRTAWGKSAGEVWQKRVIDETLLKRWGLPQDIAYMARFLASPAAEYITGQILVVNGGRV